jgi:FdhD protein
VVEEPLEIRIAGKPLCVLMRTPGHDQELAAGLLLTEGLIHGGADLKAVRPLMRKEACNAINVSLANAPIAQEERRLLVSAACGLCGKATIAELHRQFPPLDSDVTVHVGVLHTLAHTLRAHQAAFERTGGLHAAALFDLTGDLRLIREDVGRHNAVDKVLGHAVLARWLPLDRHILMVSGRASFEILQKALAARIPVIAAVSAPSLLAVDFAASSGQTLAGFLREGRLNVYSHPERILP